MSLQIYAIYAVSLLSPPLISLSLDLYHILSFSPLPSVLQELTGYPKMAALPNTGGHRQFQIDLVSKNERRHGRLPFPIIQLTVVARQAQKHHATQS